MYFSPPDHPKCAGFGLGLHTIFRAKCPFFGVAVLGNETPVLVSENQKWPGISRVNNFCQGHDKKSLGPDSESLVSYLNDYQVLAHENLLNWRYTCSKA